MDPQRGLQTGECFWLLEHIQSLNYQQTTVALLEHAIDQSAQALPKRPASSRDGLLHLVQGYSAFHDFTVKMMLQIIGK